MIRFVQRTYLIFYISMIFFTITSLLFIDSATAIYISNFKQYNLTLQQVVQNYKTPILK